MLLYALHGLNAHDSSHYSVYVHINVCIEHMLDVAQIYLRPPSCKQRGSQLPKLLLFGCDQFVVNFMIMIPDSSKY